MDTVPATALVKATATAPPPPPIECTIGTPLSPALLTPTRGHKTSDVPSMFLLDSYNNQTDSNARPAMASPPLVEEPDPNFELKLTSCPICARRFNPATYKKHVPICERTATRKRKIFDSSRQRREGTDLAAYPLPKGFGLPPVPKEIVASPKVETGAVARPPQIAPIELARRKSNDEFTRTSTRSSMRKLSNVSGTGSVEGSSSGGGNSPHTIASSSIVAATSTPTVTAKLSTSSVASSHAATPSPAASNFTRDRLRSSERTKRTQQPPAEQCPHCDRCFGMKAYDRHVAWCKEKALQNSIKHQGSKNEQNVAKERLEARTKYRAPNLKTKRALNREKYGGFPGDENDFGDQSRISGNNSIMSLSMTSSLNSEGINVSAANSNSSTIMHMYRNCQDDLEGIPSKKKKHIDEKEFYLADEEIDDNMNDFHLNGEEIIIHDRYEKLHRNTKHNINRKKSFSNITDEDGETTVGKRDLNINNEDLSSALTISQSNTMHEPKKLKPKSSKSKSNVPVRQNPIGIQMNTQIRSSIENLSIARVSMSDSALADTLQSTLSVAHVKEKHKAAIINAIISTTKSSLPISTATATNCNPPMQRPKRKSMLPNVSRSVPLKALPLPNMEVMEKPPLDIDRLEDKEVKVIKPPTRMRSALSATDLTNLSTIITTPPALIRNRSFILSGVTDKYDPFLSAKRQLEELCSPSTINDPLDSLKITNTAPTTPKTPLAPSSPFINIQPTKMSTSLTLSKSSPNSSPLTNSTIQNRTFSNLPIKATTQSNFRRTSSLRGPRRSPMLAARPLFAQKPRPTIQRGISDEGPISSSFLKPEEYDEMPVRSVCVNDFAVTNSPRVVRRDTSLSNRKNNAKNNASNTSAVGNIASGDERTSKDLLKTDSLAVFLKYETELEKLNQPNVKKPDVNAHGVVNSSTLEKASPIITKELKDKNNTLSKQNSSKNIRLEPLESPKHVDEKSNNLSTTVAPPTPNSERSTQQILNNIKYAGPPRLEPISKPGTPLTKSASPDTKPVKTPLETTILPSVKQPINLDCIFNDTKTNLSTFCKDRKLSSSTEFIDPKLINKCDNLPMNLTGGNALKHSDSDGSVQRTHSSSNSETAAPTPATQISQLTKSLAHSSGECTAQQTRQKPIAADNQSQSSECRSLLKRKMRLGLNQFLYDASPEGEILSTDDETKRSSVEYDSNDCQDDESIHKQFMSQHVPSSIPTLPTFDDFDFEEFLSSFENDDEQFPLFRDCKEFLLNRTSNRHRSTHTANSNPLFNNVGNKSPKTTTSFHFTNNNNNNNNHNNSNTKTHSSEKLQFPHLTSIHYCPNPLTPSSLRSNTTLMSKESVHAPLADNYQGEREHKKREIFISIETEQNDLGRSPISPASLRNMIGNSQTNVEVEVDANSNDNKFSKISDDEASVVSAEHMIGPYRDMHRLPNVQLNNAKNLMQRMQEDFRQVGRGISQHTMELPHRSSNRDDDCGACDSDEMSSIDSYPISSQSSRHGVGIKASADSAYGSLSRQRSSDSTAIRPSHARSRPATAGAIVNSSLQSPRYGVSKLQQQVQQQQPQQQHYRHNSKTRGRQQSGISSGSSSDNSLPPLGGYSNVSNGRYEKSLNHKYSNVNNISHKSKNNNNGIESSPTLTLDNLVAVNNNNHKNDGSHLQSNVMNQSNSSSSSMSSSTKMSKFCHECGSKFIIEHAKFCMDCGVKRIIL